MSSINYSKERKLAECIDAINKILLNPKEEFILNPPETLSYSESQILGHQELKIFESVELIKAALYQMEIE
jgi:hypothetical protein